MFERPDVLLTDAEPLPATHLGTGRRSHFVFEALPQEGRSVVLETLFLGLIDLSSPGLRFPIDAKSLLLPVFVEEKFLLLRAVSREFLVEFVVHVALLIEKHFPFLVLALVDAQVPHARFANDLQA
jgi:hypothetical protein